MPAPAANPVRPNFRPNPPRKVSDLMRINSHFRRSVQIELDFTDPGSTSGYVATEFVLNSFNRITQAFADCSTIRSWRITGDYGSGKSAFVLNLAKAACGRDKEIAPALRGRIKSNLHPVFVTGEREPLHESIGKAIIRQTRSTKRRLVPTNSAELIELVETAYEQSAGGVLLVLESLNRRSRSF